MSDGQQQSSGNNPQQGDWFASNAPPIAPGNSGDWFATNAPPPTDPQTAIRQKYGLPENVDLEKTYTDTPANLGTDLDKFGKAYTEYQASKPQPKGFLQGLWGEAKNLFRGMTSEAPIMGAPDAAQAGRVAENPANLIPGASLASARYKQSKTDPLGALGAGITDTLALAAPLILGRLFGSETAPASETAEAQTPASVPSGVKAPSPSPSAVTIGAPKTPVTSTTPAPIDAAAPSFAARLGIVDGPFEDMMTRAIKPGKNNTKWEADIATAKPDLLKAEQALGHPVDGVQDVIDAAATAKKAVWKEYAAKIQQAKAAYPNAPSMTQIDGNKIADAMMNSLDARTQLQHPEIVEGLKKVADTYRRSMSLDEAEDFLQSANNDLHSYYAKNKVNQQVASKDPSMAPTVAEGDALRKELYSTLDNLTGPGAAQIKQRYGALSNIENEAIGRKNVAARQQPQSLAEQIGMARSAGKIAVGIMRGSPSSILEGSESLATAKWLKERNTTDAIIGRAFDKARGDGSPAGVRLTPFAPGVGAASALTLNMPNQEQQQSQ